jgi:hypothetical protein
MSIESRVVPKTIESLADAVYPFFEMLAGMELDVFTPLGDGPLAAEEIAQAALNRCLLTAKGESRR